MKNELLIKDLEIEFGSFRLGPINTHICPGMITVLAGENAAGKTTLLRALADLVRPHSGSIKMLEREKVAFVFDDVFPFNNCSVRTGVEYLKSLYRDWNSARANELLERFEIPGEMRIEGLSKGKLKLFKLIMCLAQSPDLLVLDEPFDGLDPVAFQGTIDLIREFQFSGQKTVLIASHVLTDIERITDFLIVLQKGKVIYDGTVDDIRANEAEGQTLSQIVLRKLISQRSQSHVGHI